MALMRAPPLIACVHHCKTLIYHLLSHLSGRGPALINGLVEREASNEWYLVKTYSGLGLQFLFILYAHSIYILVIVVCTKKSSHELDRFTQELNV